MIKLSLIFLIITIQINRAQDVIDSAAVVDSPIVNTVSKDSININEIVLQQIETARIKDSISRAEKKVSEKNEKLDKAAVLQPKVKKSKIFSVFEGINSNVLILSGTAVFLGFIIVWRRKRIEVKSSSVKKFKKNVQLIREEKALKIENKKSREVRNKLLKKSKHLINDEGEITKKAKDLNISKGELLLASRINSYEKNRRVK